MHNKTSFFNRETKGKLMQRDCTVNVAISFDVNITSYVNKKITAYGTICKAKRQYLEHLSKMFSGNAFEISRTSDIKFEDKTVLPARRYVFRKPVKKLKS